jgi:hypothetical protein
LLSVPLLVARVAPAVQTDSMVLRAGVSPEHPSRQAPPSLAEAMCISPMTSEGPSLKHEQLSSLARVSQCETRALLFTALHVPA